jgi:hypothetical protein
VQQSFTPIALLAAILVLAIGARTLFDFMRRRRSRWQAQVLREHPELIEIASSTWHS